MRTQVDNYDTSSLEVLSIAAAPTSLELVSQLRSRLGVKVIQGYGVSFSSCSVLVVGFDLNFVKTDDRKQSRDHSLRAQG